MPALCEEYNAVKNVCAKCNINSVYKNGMCYDINCLYFGSKAECLGCKSGYEYNKRGRCVAQQDDPNCK